MWPNPEKSADLVTFSEEISNGKLHFFVQWELASIIAFLVKFKDASQLINSISNSLKKLPRYFNSTAISTSFVALLPSNFPVILVL